MSIQKVFNITLVFYTMLASMLISHVYFAYTGMFEIIMFSIVLSLSLIGLYYMLRLSTMIDVLVENKVTENN